jgi:hypothetical protein
MFQIASELEPFIVVTEVANGAPFADPIFQRKYAAPAPLHGRHLLAWYRCGNGHWRPASYLNYLPYRGAMLIGGACTDGQVLRSMNEEARGSIEASGGLMLQLVRYGEAKFEAESVGTFGHCGDARSWSVLAQCGYARLDDPHLIVRWNREPLAPARDELFAAIKTLGPF